MISVLPMVAKYSFFDIPRKSHYFSRFQRYDIIVQAVADGKRRFLDVAAGFPGSLHDARVLRNSRLYRRCENQELLTGPTMNVLGREIGQYLVADSAFFF